MRILDIDLDFFLDKVHYCLSQPDYRLDSNEYRPWASDQVRTFLEEQCGLSRVRRVRAKAVQTHDEVFYHWRRMREEGKLTGSLSVVHVDAHADLGLGDTSYDYIQTDLLHQPITERMKPKIGGMSGLAEGNYLAFAIACRWIQDLMFVHHPGGGSDLPRFIFKNHNPETRIIQLCKYDRAVNIEFVLPVECEPEVPFAVVSGPRFCTNSPFDFAYLSKSPRYTPDTSDQLLPVFEEFLDFTSGPE